MIFYTILFLIAVAALVFLLAPVYRDDSQPKIRRQCFVAAVSFLFIVGSFGLYSIFGAPGILRLMADRDERMTELTKTIETRSAQVKSDPKNLAAWVELGESFMETGQYAASANAFRESVILSHGAPDLILAYAKAMIANADGKVTDDANKALKMVLIQQPENPEARYWLAVRQLQDGHTKQAMKEMKALYHSLPDNSPLKARIDAQIGR